MVPDPLGNWLKVDGIDEGKRKVNWQLKGCFTEEGLPLDCRSLFEPQFQ